MTLGVPQSAISGCRLGASRTVDIVAAWSVISWLALGAPGGRAADRRVRAACAEPIDRGRGPRGAGVSGAHLVTVVRMVAWSRPATTRTR